MRFGQPQTPNPSLTGKNTKRKTLESCKAHAMHAMDATTHSVLGGGVGGNPSPCCGTKLRVEAITSPQQSSSLTPVCGSFLYPLLHPM